MPNRKSSLRNSRRENRATLPATSGGRSGAARRPHSKSKTARGELAVSAKPNIAVAIMAAGKGTRLKSRQPKVLHQIGGRPMLQYVIDAAKAIVPASDVCVIIGHEGERVREQMAHTGVNFVWQKEQLGTGHALMSARERLAPYDHVLVLSGDVPLLRPQTLASLRDFHLKNRAAMTIVTAEIPDPTGYGRVVRQGGGRNGNGAAVKAIVEQRALTPAQARIREMNAGIYAFSVPLLLAHLDALSRNNSAREFYLTDMAALLASAGKPVLAFRVEDAKEVLGVNNRAELAEMDARVRDAKCAELMAAGVTIFRPETCVIDADVTVGPDTIIDPCVQLLGKTTVGAECRIMSYSVIIGSEIADRVLIQPGVVMEHSRAEAGAVLGPYSHLRPGSEVGPEAHVGNFVELKKTRLGRGSKANHLTYLGDSEIGEKVNIGAGTITCNYDGTSKHRTIIQDGAFIGSDSTLVAPVTIGRDAYVGAAACITDDVPAESLAIARARQVNKEGWVRERKKRTQS